MCSTGWHMYGFPLGSIFFVVLLLFVLFLALQLFKRTEHRGASADKSSSLRILENRLASGDIGVEEFEKLKKVLES